MKMINEKGESMLAAAVLVTLIEDIEMFEITCLKKWRDKDRLIKEKVFRNMSDAISCVFNNDNKTMELWLSLSGIPICSFRKNMIEKFPNACKTMCIIN